MRAPWKWRWGQIFGLAALWAVVGVFVGQAPILALAVAAWLICWIRSGYTEPLSPTVEPLPDSEKMAGHRVVKSMGGGMSIVYAPGENKENRIEG